MAIRGLPRIAATAVRELEQPGGLIESCFPYLVRTRTIRREDTQRPSRDQEGVASEAGSDVSCREALPSGVIV